MAESEEYKAARAAEQEAAELAQLQREQESYLGAQGRPSASATESVSFSGAGTGSATGSVRAAAGSRPDPRAESSQQHDFANWPATPLAAGPQPKASGSPPPSGAEQSVAAISTITQDVDALAEKVRY